MISNEELVQAAIDATKNAYVPYSNFYVGAALVTKDGTVFTGCNIENASFTPTNCAERTAIFKAVSEGHREIVKIAVVGGPNRNLENYCPPCGVCRQVIAEFADENCQLIMGKSSGEFQVFDFYEEILPNSFTKSKLN